MAPRPHDTQQDLAADTSGAAFVEYVVVMLLVSVISAAATYSLGRPFVDYYKFAQTILSVPFP
jgi:Flp pilus assembly pilin Flp